MKFSIKTLLYYYFLFLFSPLLCLRKILTEVQRYTPEIREKTRALVERSANKGFAVIRHPIQTTYPLVVRIANSKVPRAIYARVPVGLTSQVAGMVPVVVVNRLPKQLQKVIDNSKQISDGLKPENKEFTPGSAKTGPEIAENKTMTLEELKMENLKKYSKVPKDSKDSENAKAKKVLEKKGKEQKEKKEKDEKDKEEKEMKYKKEKEEKDKKEKDDKEKKDEEEKDKKEEEEKDKKVKEEKKENDKKEKEEKEKKAKEEKEKKEKEEKEKKAKEEKEKKEKEEKDKEEKDKKSKEQKEKELKEKEQKDHKDEEVEEKKERDQKFEKHKHSKSENSQFQHSGANQKHNKSNSRDTSEPKHTPTFFAKYHGDDDSINSPSRGSSTEPESFKTTDSSFHSSLSSADSKAKKQNWFKRTIHKMKKTQSSPPTASIY